MQGALEDVAVSLYTVLAERRGCQPRVGHSVRYDLKASDSKSAGVTVAALCRLRIFGPSIGQRLIDAEMRPSGFDYMRLILAASVIFFHSLEFSSRIVDLPFLMHPPFSVWDFCVVPMFFALSGFLVAASLDRSRSPLDFATSRILRIFPALFVETLCVAVILGALLTNLPSEEYFQTPGFRIYFLNILGDIHYQLPGVFHTNPYPIANAQLWTVPYELSCYAGLAAMKLLGVYERKSIFLTIAISVVILIPHWMAVLGIANYRHAVVVPCFLAGAAMNLYRHRVPWNRWVFLISLLALPVAVTVPHMSRFLPIPLAYAIIFLGTLNPKRTWLIRSGDYSYGMYLYGFPVMQALIALVPAARIWYVNFSLTILATGCLAALSWHLIEKRCLALKPRSFRFNADLQGFGPWTSGSDTRMAGRESF